MGTSGAPSSRSSIWRPVAAATSLSLSSMRARSRYPKPRFASPKLERRTSGTLTSRRRRPSSGLANACRTTSGGRSLPFAIAVRGTARAARTAMGHKYRCITTKAAGGSNASGRLRGLPTCSGSAIVAVPPAPVRAAAFTTVSVTIAIGAAVDEFLDATAADRFARVQIAFRVDGHHVQEGEVSGHVPGPPEPIEDRVRRPEERGPVVEDPHDLVSAVGLVHESLLPVGREIDVPCGPGGPERSRAGDDRNGSHEGAVLLIDIDPIVAAIARVHKPVLADHDAMRMAAIAGGELAGTRAHAAHLAQVCPVPVKDRHAVVAVAVRDVDIPVGRIHGDVRRQVQEGFTVAFRHDVRASAAAGRIVVAEKLGSNLEQQGAAIVRILLHNAIAAVTADPDVVFEIDEAAVNAIRQVRVLAGVRPGRHDRGATPAVDHVALGVELDDRRGSSGSLGKTRHPFWRGQTARLETTGH